MKSPTFEGKSCNTFTKIQPSRQPIENPSPFGKVLLWISTTNQNAPVEQNENPQQNLNPTKLQSIYIGNFDMKIPTTQRPNGKSQITRHLLPSCHQWGTGELCSLRTVAGWSTTLVLPDDQRAGWRLLSLQIHSNHRSWPYFLRGGVSFRVAG